MNLATPVRSVLRSFGLDVVRYRDDWFIECNPEKISIKDMEIIAKAKRFSMTSSERLWAMIQAARYVERRRIEGGIVECGVYQGGSIMAAILAGTTKELYLFDTFSGMPRPDERDGQTASAQFHSGWCEASLEEVRRNLSSTGYDDSRIHYVKGMVEDTIPDQAPKQIALLRLDTDWYESTKHELLHLYPRLAPGGVLIVDDYGHWQGCRRAVDEYFQEAPVLLNRIDYSGRIAVKPC